MTVSSLTPGFMVLHGNRPELLRQVVLHVFRAHPLRPLENEIMLVQSSGIAQWLKLALASSPANGGCGIAAAMDMQLPSRFVWQAYRTVLGKDQVPDASPLDKSRLLWRLLRLLPAQLSAPEFASLARFLAGDTDGRRHYQLAERIADLFDQYQVYRADWLGAWEANDDVLLDVQRGRRDLDPAHRWQPVLWRAILDDVGPARSGGRAVVHQAFMRAMASAQQRPEGLPARLTVFGVTSLPQQSLEVLRGLSRFMQVILCVNNPCEHYWTNLLSERDMVRSASGRHRRRPGSPAILSEDVLHLHAHPLLAAWGRQGRDYIALLDETDDPLRYRDFIERTGGRIDVFESGGEATLLNQLQDDIRALRPLAESRARWPAVQPAADRSIRFHVAHSAQREVEILHDQLLDAMETDPTLTPRDIVVMVPDVDAYAPHINAVFGQIDRSDPRYIAHSIADLSQRQRQPLARAVEGLLHLPESRLGASEIFDLLDVPALRQRFGLSAEDLQTLQRWVGQVGIRWGLDAEHRARFIAHGQVQNTWRHGLARMLLGYAAGQDASGREASDWHDIEPYAEVAGLDAALVGPLVGVLDAIERLIDTLSVPATPAVWCERLLAMLEAFLQVESADDIALQERLRESLLEWTEHCAQAGLEAELSLAVVRDHWMAQWEHPSLSHRFMAGQLTFATLMPMRAIPFRMVCLLGMSDGQFPRVRAPVDFDLMAQLPRPGDRSRRDDDRYLFLEALLSARERLHISWVGRSAVDNAECPPSVLVAQLRDHLNAGWALADARGAAQASGGVAEALTVHHRLQAFSRAYFGRAEGHPESDGDASGGLFTYAHEWERRPAEPRRLSQEDPLSLLVPDRPVALTQLVAFLRDPVATFYRDRLGVVAPREVERPDDQEPFALDGLSRWVLQDELIQSRLDAMKHGRSQDEAMTRVLGRMRRRGALPIGARADLIEDELTAPLDAMFLLYARERSTWPDALDDWSFEREVAVGGMTVTVRGLITHRCRGEAGLGRVGLESTEFIAKKKYRPEKVLNAWVHHLASHLLGEPTTTVWVGKNGAVTLRPMPIEDATAAFDALVAAYLEGLRMPLPVAPATAAVWLQRGGHALVGEVSAALKEAYAFASSCYEGSEYGAGEAERSAYRQQVYPSFSQLWRAGQFSHWSDVLYKPMLQVLGAEKVTP